jgi:hypothetical protein
VTPLSASLPLLVSNVKLALSTSLWWYALVALALLTVAYFVYRFTLPPVENLRRVLLWTLRGLALILIALLLFEPVLSYVFSRRQPPTVALLIDHSASIDAADSTDRRSAILNRWLPSATSKLAGETQLRVFEFADSVSEIARDSVNRVVFTGVGTDIAGAVDKAKRALADQHLAAVLVVSDGAYNIGENPVRIASESTAPIYTIGVGDTATQRDIVISQMLTNEVTYVGATVPVDLRVRGRGFKGRETVLKLLGPQGKEYAHEVVRFPDDDAELSFHMNFVADRPGDMRVTAEAVPISSEALTENNRRSVIVKVLENKSRVYVFSGPPTADLTALRQTLEADTTLNVDIFVESSGGSFLYNRQPPSEDDFSKGNLIVAVNFPSQTTDDAVLQRIRQAVSEKNVPFLFFAGPQVSVSRLRALADVLPFEPRKQNLSDERVVVREASSPAALAGKSPLTRDWKDLPPVNGGLDNFGVKPVAQVAAKLSRESLGLTEDEPALALWQMNRREGAAFFCWGLYRWKLQTPAGGMSFYEQLIPRLVSWLIAPAEEQRVRIRTTKRLYSGGERVQFVAQVYGANLAPRDDATINLRVSSGSRSEVVAMRNRGNGRYEGALNSWAEGDYEFSGTAQAESDTLGSDRGRFAVEAFNVELIDTRARPDILQGMANVSRGAYVPFERADSLLSALRFTAQSVTTRREFSLWNRALMVWLIIALLAAEWIIRKRSGML